MHKQNDNFLKLFGKGFGISVDESKRKIEGVVAAHKLKGRLPGFFR